MQIFRKNWLSLFLFLPFIVGCVPLTALSVGAGASTGAIVSEDRRTSGMFIEDESIELKSARRINQQLGDNVHINVTSFNRIVLLTGTALNEAMKKEAEVLVMSVDNVRSIVNEVKIAEKQSLASRSNDTLVTSKVKTRFIGVRGFQINHVKIVTENKIVYLMGMVKREEAESAAEIASSTVGVEKVVRVFEYLD
ncbi:MAG: BON domain-containing protein [Betaproteobacteria bacterium]|nr:BON domain-containing protein [Betaproteobacteria bacterium]